MSSALVGKLNRRMFIATASAAAVGAASGALGVGSEANSLTPIIDTHIHLFDQHRPQGAPYSGPPNSPTATTGALPDGYKKLVGPLGVIGAIHIDASNWVEDNLWVLETCASHDIMVGVVGNLNPEAAEFAEFLDRYQRNPLFRGVRYGNLWGYDLAGQSRNRAVLDRLKLLAQADLVMDAANPNVEMLEGIISVNDAVPDLRIVIDHLPAMETTSQIAAAYSAALRELRQRPTIFCKLSEIIHAVDGKVSTNLSDYKPRLDRLSEVFGENRVLFGSDWPNSYATTSIENVFKIARDYFASKPRAAAEKYFWRNSIRAYKWIKRSPEQQALT